MNRKKGFEKRIAAVVVSFVMVLTLIAGAGCADGTTQDSGGDTRTFVDSCGRSVEIPAKLTRIAPSGQVAQMMIYAVCPDALIGWSSKLSDMAKEYIDEKYHNLPLFGQFYGKNVSLNLEALIEAEPEVIIDMGDMKETHAADMDEIQEQVGIPVIFIEANMECFAKAMTTLGELTGETEQGDALSAYITETMDYAGDRRARLTEEDVAGVYFGTGESGLDANAAGSIHSTVLDIVGAENATVVEEVSSKGGGNTINMEQLYEFNPDVIILMPDGAYETVFEDEAWSELDAVKGGRCYEIPAGPFNFMASPPSINALIGVKWLGNLIYPELYDLDMAEEAQEFYSLFWHYELSEAEARELMKNSTYLESPSI